ncbi:MAG: hypothetical protein ACTSPI_14940, partial [Candidatus Heimdallarchaeaceae archaeon]
MWIGQPCPMARTLDDKRYCILDGDFDEMFPILFDDIKKITKEMLEPMKSPISCMNAVIENRDHTIMCPTKDKPIIIKGMR